MISGEAVAALLSEGLTRNLGGDDRESTAYTLRVLTHFDGQLEVELRQSGEVARTWIALPESGRPTPWICLDPVDAEDWVDQLGDWLNEEMFTGGLGAAYHRETDGEIPHLLVDGYGFRLADPGEHRRLRRAIGPHGWQDGGRPSRGAIKRQYASEWALDLVEQQLREEPRMLRDEPDPPLEWSLTSPDGVGVYVEADPVADGGKEVDVELTAMAGFRRRPSARRRISPAAEPVD